MTGCICNICTYIYMYMYISAFNDNNNNKQTRKETYLLDLALQTFVKEVPSCNNFCAIHSLAHNSQLQTAVKELLGCSDFSALLIDLHLTHSCGARWRKQTTKEAWIRLDLALLTMCGRELPSHYSESDSLLNTCSCRARWMKWTTKETYRLTWRCRLFRRESLRHC